MYLSPKQQNALTNSNARINSWEGAVRSGKSYSALLRFVEFIASPIVGDMVIVGITEDAIKRNIISELERLIGQEVRYSPGNRLIKLWNRDIHVIGANDERAERKIRGATFAGALVDEVTMLPESFFSMLLSRLSVTGAKLFGTTNPDNPFHWFKVNYLDEPGLDLARFFFDLDDNPVLSTEYKEALKKEYRGLWYKRFIEGKWVLAEGTVYDFFDEKLHIIEEAPKRADFYIIGIDYGTVNPTAFVKIGYNPLAYPNMWVESEYYWDSKKEQRQKVDSEYAEDLSLFLGNDVIRSIYIDPSAASFIAECRRQGIGNIVLAENEVIDGIRHTGDLLINGTLKVCRRCRNLIKEMGTYTWDENASNRGVEKPKKANDHCMDALRYGAMHWYERRKDSSASEYEKLNEDLGPRC